MRSTPSVRASTPTDGRHSTAASQTFRPKSVMAPLAPRKKKVEWTSGTTRGDSPYSSLHSHGSHAGLDACTMDGIK